MSKMQLSSAADLGKTGVALKIVGFTANTVGLYLVENPSTAHLQRVKCKSKHCLKGDYVALKTLNIGEW